MLPPELRCGSGMTCWRRVRDWQRAGIWDLIHFALLDWLARNDEIDWSRASHPPLLAKRRTIHGSVLGRWRSVVERTFAWLNQF